MSSGGAQIRPAGPLDAGAVGGILSRFAAETAWLPRLYSGAEDIAHAGEMIARGWVEVALAGGAAPLAGFIARDGAELHALYLAPEARGQGLGRALLDRAKAASPQLALWTCEANAGARAFYAREGFGETGRGTTPAAEGGLPAVRMTWERKAA